MFREHVVEANGLAGQDASEIGNAMLLASEIDYREMRLRHNAPLAVCMLCTCETRGAKKHHSGALMHIDGFIEHRGE